MERVARLAARERSELFAESAARMGTTPAVVEKDFWVSWVLRCLFADAQLANWLMFKGGTSLSKAYGLIQRFSEDIDLVLDWRTVSNADPLAKRSQTQQNKLNADIEAEAVRFIAGELLGRIRPVLGELCVCEVEVNDAHVINVRYPAAFPDAYLRPEVRLEIGPLAAWLPHELRRVSCYAAEQFPAVFTQRDFEVRVIRAERTFWEKATILHHEAYRPAGNLQPARYSRHYYDLARMAASPVRAAALADFGLLAEVVAFKRRFYPRGWARYELAVPGSLSLVPHGEVLGMVETDYRAMQGMIFGQVPGFPDIISALTGLETEINRGK